jgi:hypothetical protein
VVFGFYLALWDGCVVVLLQVFVVVVEVLGALGGVDQFHEYADQCACGQGD